MRAALSILCGLALASGARADAPACRAQARIEPERAVVGQQVLYRVHVLRRDDVSEVEWEEPPAFPNARAEALPPEPDADVPDEGFLYHAQDELRAVFPEREGRLALGVGVLRCRTSGGGTQPVRVAPASLDVRPFPAQGRPADFSGLVGPVLLSLTVTPERVALGGSVRVALMARGPGNLWQLDDSPLRRALGEVEVFARPSELALEPGRGLFVSQHFALDAVPRATGRLLVAPLRVPYFDPEAGVYRVATTEEVPVVVEERAVEAPMPGERAEARSELTPPGVAAPRAGWIPWVAAACALAGGAGALRLRRRPADAAGEALAQAARARASGDRAGELAAQARALRAALARDLPGAGALAVEELEARAERPAARKAAALLAALERARFAQGAAPPAADEIGRAVRALGAGRAARAVLLLFALGVVLGTGCASGLHRGDPMTPARLEATLRAKAGDFENVEGQLRFTFGGVRMVCVYDLHADRMRIIASVTDESTLTEESERILLRANFTKTFDARYALYDGILYAVYLHPLSTLDPRELEDALPQVARLVRNYGTTYSAGKEKR
ncbi:MAG TPA: hypothetical protein VMW19_08000 [Myxococcota bacterium]|nr:hypothetical protein [Myxococcota bacterium]